MPAKKASVPKTANVNGAVKSRGRFNGVKTEPKQIENGKNKEPCSPNSNLENISPIPRKKLRETESFVQKEMPSLPITPKGKNGLRSSRLDKSYDASSPLETTSTTQTSKAIIESKTKEKAENLFINHNDHSDSLNQSLATPKNSFIFEDNDGDKSDRQLRSSGKKAPKIINSPARRSKNAEKNTAAHSVNESGITTTDAGKVALADDQNISAEVAEDENEEKQQTEVAGTDNENQSQTEVSDTENEEESVHLENFNKTNQNDEVALEESTASFVATQKIDHDDHELVEHGQPTASVSVMDETMFRREIDYIKSPSTASVDSAKGSSIVTEADCTVFHTGALYWGQIHSFCYWPCMVCPDDNDNEEDRITRTVEQQFEVHVRFFADNARHSWVKRGNLLRYLGLKQYKELTNIAKEKYGEKSPKCKIFFPKRSKKDIWRSAVKEADDMANVPFAERLQKFFEVNKERIIEEKLRRQSLNMSKSNLNLSLNASALDNSDTSDLAKKRSRSASPISPEFSPLRKEIKRRKTTTATNSAELIFPHNSDTDDLNKIVHSSSSSNAKLAQQQSSEPFDSSDLKAFYEAIKEYITDGLLCEPEFEFKIYRSVKTLWTMKEMVEKAKVSRVAANASLPPNIENASKRLSMRLQDIQKRQSIQIFTATSSAPSMSPLQVTHPVTEKRRSSTSLKQKNRPMTEVIDDIFNLDKLYLYENLSGRAPVCKYCFKPDAALKRCSCLSWFHTNCTPDSEIKNTTKTPSKRRSNKRKSSFNNVDLISITHVTADDDSAGSDSAKQNTPTPSSTVKNDNKDDIVVDLVETSAIKEKEPPIVCKECANDEKPKCFVCKTEKIVKPTNTATTTTENDENNVAVVLEELHMCNMPNCGRAYHLSCLTFWPQYKTTFQGKSSTVSLCCPSHSCHTCVSDDPKGKYQQLKDNNTTKCVKCPATYHMDSTCIPAGSKMLNASHIICPRHGLKRSDQHVNVSWCFICVRGGSLICCETCPTTVHAECTNVKLEANENYICDECESGRLPLYGEMVWAKFNSYRWWPAIILPPTEVPLNIRDKPHNPFDFVIRFFGTHDHGWISRRRVYLYVEGDWSDPPKQRRHIDQNYLLGVNEAKYAYEIVKKKTIERENKNGEKDKLHPHPYVKIRINRAVPPVKLHQNIEMVNKCSCDPNGKNPCDHESNCLNRALYHECNPKICPAGKRCQNQMFETRISPALEIFYAKKERGFGLRCREAITSGSFIIEYVGEVINSEEFQRRMEKKSADRDENYYFLSLEKDYIIDAGPKGNMARFMNHSCDPNCETQKWSVNGLNRVGLFAIKDILANTELTFNYHWDELLGSDKKVCCCGSPNCTGQIGNVPKKEIKKKQAIEANNLSSSSRRPKAEKRRSSSLHSKSKGKQSISQSPPHKRAKSATRKKRAGAVDSPNASKKIDKSNEKNNND